MTITDILNNYINYIKVFKDTSIIAGLPSYYNWISNLFKGEEKANIYRLKVLGEYEKIRNDFDLAEEFKDYLSNPSVKLINCLDNNYVRKYGSWDIAYHEAGYVESDNEYYLIILTQLNKYDYKEEFINKTAKLLDEINKELS